MTTLHAGGKFGGKVYETSGGLHGVGASVVNALSEWMEVEVARDKRGSHACVSSAASRRQAARTSGAVNRRGTIVSFKPDAQIFGKEAQFSPPCSIAWPGRKAYLFRGVEIRWKCDPSLIKSDAASPAEETLKFPGGLLDFLTSEIGKARRPSRRERFPAGRKTATARARWNGRSPGRRTPTPFLHSYCNTIPTPQGGTHEQGLRNALSKALRSHGERVNNRKTSLIMPEDIMGVCLRCPVGVHPRAGIPGADQGKTVDGRCATAGRKRRARPFRPLAGRKPARSRPAARLSSSTRPRTGSSGKAGKRRLAQRRRRANCACPASSPIARAMRRRAPKFFWSKATSRAARPNRRATARPRRSCRCAAKSSMSPAPRAGKLEQNQELADLVLALGCGTGAKYRDRRSAL